MGEEIGRDASIDARIEGLAIEVAEWAKNFGLLDGSDESSVRTKSLVIATFVVHCSPQRPTPLGTRLAAHITALFFFLDDLPRERVEEEARRLLEVLAERDLQRTEQGGPAAALREYLGEIEVQDRQRRYRREFRALLLGMEGEARRAQMGPWALADFKEYRLEVIFVREYAWSWLLSEYAHLTNTVSREGEALFDLASEIVAIVNDLASVERDRANGGIDPNLVLLVESQGLSFEEALESVIESHASLTTRYEAEREKLLSSSGAGSAAIAEVLDFVVHGNFIATVALTKLRYPRTVEILERLRSYRVPAVS